MTPVPSPPKRPRKGDDPFDDIFGDFDAEFRRMQEQLNAFFQEALKGADIPKGANQPGNPFVYGFTMRLGPDGRPHIEQFGNTRGHAPGGRPEVAVEGGREPITDLIEHDDHLTVTVELPGVQKEDVQVYTTATSLTIKVDTAQRRYYKQVELPAEVVPESTEATFKNAVLDVTLKKQERQAPPTGHRVNVK